MVVIHDGQLYHRLMHNSSFSRDNGPVNEGDEIAKAGSTGLSTGVHCHWDINNEGTYPTTFNSFINPNEWLKGEEMIGDTDNEYSRWDKVATQIRGRHRGFTRDEFRSAAVGRTWLQANEILSDDPESDKYYSDSNLSADDLNNLMGELGVPTPPNPNDIEYHINQQDGHWKTSFYDLIQRADRVKIPDLLKVIDSLKAQAVKTGPLDPKLQAQLDKIDQNTTQTTGIVQWIKDKLAAIFR